MKKNYVCFVNDHSGSMSSLRTAAMKDFNTNQSAVRDAATAEKQDTIVSVLNIGMGEPGKKYDRNDVVPSPAFDVWAEVVVSNPHILEPKDQWPTQGGTPLYDAIADAINLHFGLPDINREDVSVLIMITTDGEEAGSRRHTHGEVKALVAKANATGRFTITVRAPSQASRYDIENLVSMGISPDNIQRWDTTAKGLDDSTKVQTASVNSFFRARAAGAKSSTSFYTDASNVNVAALDKIDPKEISLYVVPADQNGVEIRPFVLTKRMEHLYGAAFYQLTKTEAKVGPEKVILIRDRATGFFFNGKAARTMLGLPTDKNVRLNPGDHGAFDLFIQSNSINRKLVGGSGLAYWPKAPGARAFTAADTAYLDRQKPATATSVTGAQVTQLPQVTPTNKPTPSPIPVTPAMHKFETRDEARDFCRAERRPQTTIVDLGKSHRPRKERWQVPVKKS